MRQKCCSDRTKWDYVIPVILYTIIIGVIGLFAWIPACYAQVNPFTEKPIGEQFMQALGPGGNWALLSAAVLSGVMFLLKQFGALNAMGRWRYILLPVLSLASSLLAYWATTKSVTVLITVFFSSWSMGMVEELVSHGILNKPADGRYKE